MDPSMILKMTVYHIFFTSAICMSFYPSYIESDFRCDFISSSYIRKWWRIMGKNIKMHYSLQSEGRKSSVLLLWGGQRLPQHHRTPRSHVERDEARWGTKKAHQSKFNKQRHTILNQQNCKSKDLQFGTPWNDGIAIFRPITKKGAWIPSNETTDPKGEKEIPPVGVFDKGDISSDFSFGGCS